MLPAVLLALVAFVVVPLFPGDLPSGEATEIPPVHLIARVSPQQPASTDKKAARLVDRVADFLQARHLSVIADGGGGFHVAPGTPTISPIRSISTAPERFVELSVGLNSSFLPVASGLETRYGGDPDVGWRLAYQVQRNLAGGMSDVLGYETYDRGVFESDGDSAQGAGSLSLQTGSQSNHPWVATYPLYATNAFEAGLIESPGGVDVLAVAISNAVADYLNPATGSPRRTIQAGWSRMRPWQPVEAKSIYSADGSPMVAFTFDGGASSEPTPAILKALRGAGVRATMFMTADFVERNPDLVVQMARDGHEFGNHSSTHPDMTSISDRAIVAELDGLENAVVALTGKSTRPWFRPPFGAIDDRVLRTVADQGYYSIMWTADSADWRTDIDASTVASRLLRYSEPGAIMIEHLGSPQSAEVLAGVLRQLAGQGIKVGTLSEVVGTP